MLHTNVKAVLEGTLDTGDEFYCVYVLPEDDVVLYVGRSTNSEQRLREHLDCPGETVEEASGASTSSTQSTLWSGKSNCIRSRTVNPYMLHYLSRTVEQYRNPAAMS